MSCNLFVVQKYFKSISTNHLDRLVALQITYLINDLTIRRKYNSLIVRTRRNLDNWHVDLLFNFLWSSLIVESASSCLMYYSRRSYRTWQVLTIMSQIKTNKIWSLVLIELVRSSGYSSHIVITMEVRRCEVLVWSSSGYKISYKKLVWENFVDCLKKK